MKIILALIFALVQCYLAIKDQAQQAKAKGSSWPSLLRLRSASHIESPTTFQNNQQDESGYAANPDNTIDPDKQSQLINISDDTKYPSIIALLSHEKPVTAYGVIGFDAFRHQVKDFCRKVAGTILKNKRLSQDGAHFAKYCNVQFGRLKILDALSVEPACKLPDRERYQFMDDGMLLLNSQCVVAINVIFKQSQTETLALFQPLYVTQLLFDLQAGRLRPNFPSHLKYTKSEFVTRVKSQVKVGFMVIPRNEVDNAAYMPVTELFVEESYRGECVVKASYPGHSGPLKFLKLLEDYYAETIYLIGGLTTEEAPVVYQQMIFKFVASTSNACSQNSQITFDKFLSQLLALSVTPVIEVELGNHNDDDVLFLKDFMKSLLQSFKIQSFQINFSSSYNGLLEKVASSLDQYMPTKGPVDFTFRNNELISNVYYGINFPYTINDWKWYKHGKQGVHALPFHHSGVTNILVENVDDCVKAVEILGVKRTMVEKISLYFTRQMSQTSECYKPIAAALQDMLVLKAIDIRLFSDDNDLTGRENFFKTYYKLIPKLSITKEFKMVAPLIPRLREMKFYARIKLSDRNDKPPTYSDFDTYDPSVEPNELKSQSFRVEKTRPMLKSFRQWASSGSNMEDRSINDDIQAKFY